MTPPTRWLSEPEQRAWRAYLEASRLLFETLDRELQKDVGIPHAYYEILVNLSEAPERGLRMSQLAACTRSSRSRLSHAVDRLEERGWITRLECPTDRRGQVAVLTDAGQQALATAAPGHVRAVREFMLDLLSAEQIGQLEQISATIIAGVVAVEQACARVG
jgi:DNA-binding MarR family transcriptional regulator